MQVGHRWAPSAQLQALIEHRLAFQEERGLSGQGPPMRMGSPGCREPTPCNKPTHLCRLSVHLNMSVHLLEKPGQCGVILGHSLCIDALDKL